ncbi:unnamed protein product [Vicia faba]|uniref:Uncharacterized protein n=1 Tax=Vicia faba TaxID=3906 RepID=A0AAV0YLB5_VICFA|nr:unnamed protein product [Vicia faba]
MLIRFATVVPTLTFFISPQNPHFRCGSNSTSGRHRSIYVSSQCATSVLLFSLRTTQWLNRGRNLGEILMEQWKESVVERRFLKMEEGDNIDEAERAEDDDEKVEEAER